MVELVVTKSEVCISRLRFFIHLHCKLKNRSLDHARGLLFFPNSLLQTLNCLRREKFFACFDINARWHMLNEKEPAINFKNIGHFLLDKAFIPLLVCYCQPSF